MNCSVVDNILHITPSIQYRLDYNTLYIYLSSKHVSTVPPSFHLPSLLPPDISMANWCFE